MDAQKLSFLLKSCISNKSLSQGKLLHSKSIPLGLQQNLHLSKSLINFYISFNLFDSAKLVLQTIENRSETSLWNSLIAAYSKNHMQKQALLLFAKLHRSPSLKPDIYTYPSALKACGASGNIKNGKMIHAHFLKSGFGTDIVASSSLVGMYAKCGLFDFAARVFDEMSEKDVASWNTVISCYYQDGQAQKALEMFDRMVDQGFKPDPVTFTMALSACARVSDLEKGRRIHEELVRNGVELDEFVGSALVDMYGKCGCVKGGREVFEEIPMKNVITWNTVIGAYSLTGDSYSCLELFSRMNKEGIQPTVTTVSNLLLAFSRSSDLRNGKFIHGYTLRKQIDDIFANSLLIDLYFKCENVNYAESLFERMPKENTVTWNVMISGYVATGLYFKALNAFNEMRMYSIRLDAFSFASVLSACAQLAAIEQGKEIHKQISDCNLESHEIVMCALLDMYAKCGAVKEARLVFDGLQFKDKVSWTSMITAYGSHGQASEALEIFNEMVRSNVRPDNVAFLGVLSACSHAGLVDEGCYYFNQMTNYYGIKPGVEHFSCLVDLLGRAGRLKEALEILKSMTNIKLDAGLLGSLFSACSLHGNLELGEELARFLVEMDPDDHFTYVVLSNMYASAGKWTEVRKMRSAIKERGLKKNPGCSWIEIDKEIHQFYADDDSHQQTEWIYECLEKLLRNMEEDKCDLFGIVNSWMDEKIFE
ncbi:uncharacterized protein A4U43_C04F9740 [Asparagus officinalis]|uniref:Uncharacterized protein n=1 Tax=Asparagus officinalis TaxID=4686 RepID=A0A5P1EZM8_ASPOF|nr:pentatricopeptide repeat-containing protein At5g27110 [Asparagus officinalis]XP_020260633.1 pentatricopeptide repeat-containing protein At5g27110 [Asparagus officinalis]XP_020260634.1 pentatricopeptide repeat-containing protein At5g27110 [Asparagus officinalis]XP_020260635.1 pentatricopeptide repeat-containing protein At5g27110 [Asparagus officinalis]XP_020260636.1 pentatricopeptide repeat-containing protein At5g27110 [Asparagus officinalis]XP_020260637.1 pentatricopeptide repeat-containing